MNKSKSGTVLVNIGQGEKPDTNGSNHNFPKGEDLVGGYVVDSASSYKVLNDAEGNREIYSGQLFTNANSTGSVSATSTENQVSIDTSDPTSIRNSLQGFFGGLKSGEISYDALEMKNLASGLEQIFGRFVTSFSYCDEIVTELIQNGDSSAVHSDTYGPALINYWTENASEYENFTDLAANWIDLVSVTASNNEKTIDEIVSVYKKNSE